MAKQVIVYSTVACPYCVMVKEWLDKNNVKYKNVNVAEDEEAAQEMVEKSGQMGVPVIEIKQSAKDEKGKIIVGFNKGALAKELGIKE